MKDKPQNSSDFCSRHAFVFGFAAGKGLSIEWMMILADGNFE